MVNDNLIELIPSSSTFTCLESLSISSNRIHSWESIVSMDRFPQLSTLRFSGNPLNKEYPTSVFRLLIIARLPKLSSLNGSLVRPAERNDAEKFYLKYCVTEKE